MVLGLKLFYRVIPIRDSKETNVFFGESEKITPVFGTGGGDEGVGELGGDVRSWGATGGEGGDEGGV